ncbi:hypothetical protein BaRGS_00036465 [Batillaria attramentaria]|uniref:Uncharacterized protein n=1 Tax=Batillaria attramentaria TaxID=370345 RepID=A0ABD0JBP5_9CAEN
MQLLAYVTIFLMLIRNHALAKAIAPKRYHDPKLLELVWEVEEPKDVRHNSDSTSVGSELEKLLAVALRKMRTASDEPQSSQTQDVWLEEGRQALNGGYTARLVANDGGVQTVDGTGQELRQNRLRRVDRTFRSCLGHGGIGGINRLCDPRRLKP